MGKKQEKQDVYDVLGSRPLPPDASKAEKEARADAMLEAQLEAIGNREED